MRRQNTRSERHSRHPKDTALLETMEAALEDTADASGCRDASWSMYLWICTMHIQPPHVTHVAWKWWAYSIHPFFVRDIIVIFVKTSRQSPNLHNWTNNLSAGWKCMDNHWDGFSHCNSQHFWTELAQEPSVDIVLRLAFHLKTASREYFDCVLRLQRSDNWYEDWFGTYIWGSLHFQLNSVMCWGF